MSAKDRERLQNIRNAPHPASSTTASPSAPISSPSVLQFIPEEINIPELHPSVAKAALHGFQPFSSDPVKQSRYTAFLQFQASRGDDLSRHILGVDRLDGQSLEDFNKELSDYAKSATVFKPLSGAMAGRFRSAVIVESGPKIVEGLHTPALTEQMGTDEDEKKENEKEREDPKMGAVRLGMYGPLTRDVQPWQPAKLLCKRFGVKEPEVSEDALNAAAESGASAQKDGWSSDLATQGVPTGTTESATATATAAITDGISGGASRSSGPRNLANVGLGEDETQGRDTLTYQRPSMDIFKAIFASDDEDSDNDEDDGNEKKMDVLGAQPGAATASEPIPAHYLSSENASASYDPQIKDPTSSTNGLEKVDIASFKPTFVPRSERESRKGKEREKDKTKKDKKSAPKMALSFDVEEEGLNLNISAPSKKEKKHKDRDGDRKRKKRKEKQEEDEDESMWVEKPPADAVKNLASQHLEPLSAEASVTDGVSSRAQSAQDPVPPLRGRKRAIDFM